MPKGKGYGESKMTYKGSGKLKKVVKSKGKRTKSYKVGKKSKGMKKGY